MAVCQPRREASEWRRPCRLHERAHPASRPARGKKKVSVVKRPGLRCFLTTTLTNDNRCRAVLHDSGVMPAQICPQYGSWITPGSSLRVDTSFLSQSKGDGQLLKEHMSPASLLHILAEGNEFLPPLSASDSETQQCLVGVDGARGSASSLKRVAASPRACPENQRTVVNNNCSSPRCVVSHHTLLPR